MRTQKRDAYSNLSEGEGVEIKCLQEIIAYEWSSDG